MDPVAAFNWEKSHTGLIALTFSSLQWGMVSMEACNRFNYCDLSSDALQFFHHYKKKNADDGADLRHDVEQKYVWSWG